VAAAAAAAAVAAPRPRRWLEPAASRRSTSASGTACKRDPPPLRSLAEVAPVPRAIHAHARYSPSHSRTMSVPMILSASASNRSILRDVRACSSLLVISIEPSDVDVNVNVNVSTVSISYVREVDGWMGLVGWVVVCGSIGIDGVVCIVDIFARCSVATTTRRPHTHTQPRRRRDHVLTYRARHTWHTTTPIFLSWAWSVACVRACTQ